MKHSIAGYCRISVDEELDRENTSIGNQRSIIEDFVERKFPGSTLDFFEDRDRSGYTFEQREGYQRLRPQLLDMTYDILIVKDFSRFSRRNSKGLVELEDLRDAGLRIIAIGDSIDYPTYDDWTAIQFRFLINEMPVTDTSKKVKSVIQRRQSEGKWICSVPYGYVVTNSKMMKFEVDGPAAEIVREIFRLYNEGDGYKKIANHLTELRIPTPRAVERARKEARGEECKLQPKQAWSIITVSEILANDFYIGTLRQGKYRRKKINGVDVKTDEMEHVVFENHHEAIIDFRTFAVTQEQLKKRSTTHYRGVKKNDNVYSGFIWCGDCGSPMFAMSRRDLRPAYTCGTYHSRGTKGCTSHHTRVDVLDTLLKSYVRRVRDNSADMIDKLNQSLRDEQTAVKESTSSLELLQRQIDDARQEMKILARQQAKELLRNPDRETAIDEMYREMLDELADRIDGLQNQLELTSDRRNTVIRVNRIAKTALDIFDDILNKEKLDKTDLEFILDKIVVFEDHIEIHLKSDIDALLLSGELPEETVTQSSKNRKDKILGVHVISSGDPLEIFTDADGEVIFKKYSPVGELSSTTRPYAEVLFRGTNLPVIITDRDRVIACAGLSKKEAIDRRVTSALETVIENRTGFTASPGGERLRPVEGLEREAAVACPIIGGGDVSGCVIMLMNENGAMPTMTEVKLIQVAASFLGRQMEE